MPMPAMLSFSLGGLDPPNPRTRPGTTMKAAEAIAAPPMNWRRDSWFCLGRFFIEVFVKCANFPSDCILQQPDRTNQPFPSLRAETSPQYSQRGGPQTIQTLR